MTVRGKSIRRNTAGKQKQVHFRPGWPPAFLRRIGLGRADRARGTGSAGRCAQQVLFEKHNGFMAI